MIKKCVLVLTLLTTSGFTLFGVEHHDSKLKYGTKHFVNKSDGDVYVVFSPKQRTICSLNLVALVPQGQTRLISYHGGGDHPALERVAVYDAQGKEIAEVTDARGLNTHKIITFAGAKNVGLSNPPLSAEQLKSELNKLKQELRQERMRNHFRADVKVKELEAN